jgi:hypothetical protein
MDTIFNTDIKARTSLIRVQHDTIEMEQWSIKTREKILAKKQKLHPFLN